MYIASSPNPFVFHLGSHQVSNWDGNEREERELLHTAHRNTITSSARTTNKPHICTFAPQIQVGSISINTADVSTGIDISAVKEEPKTPERKERVGVRQTV